MYIYEHTKLPKSSHTKFRKIYLSLHKHKVRCSGHQSLGKQTKYLSQDELFQKMSCELTLFYVLFFSKVVKLSTLLTLHFLYLYCFYYLLCPPVAGRSNQGWKTSQISDCRNRSMEKWFFICFSLTNKANQHATTKNIPHLKHILESFLCMSKEGNRKCM